MKSSDCRLCSIDPICISLFFCSHCCFHLLISVLANDKFCWYCWTSLSMSFLCYWSNLRVQAFKSRASCLYILSFYYCSDAIFCMSIPMWASVSPFILMTSPTNRCFYAYTSLNTLVCCSILSVYFFYRASIVLFFSWMRSDISLFYDINCLFCSMSMGALKQISTSLRFLSVGLMSISARYGLI